MTSLPGRKQGLTINMSRQILRNRSALLVLAATAVLFWFSLAAIRPWQGLPFLTMPKRDNIYELPKNLPVPPDDGACNHLVGLRIPSLLLTSTRGGEVDLSSLRGRTVVYCYPRSGRPDQDIPKGWNEIPGARGCTPQSCAFRDHYQELQKLGARVFGLSTQDTDYQREAAERLHLPFGLLSDSSLTFTHALRLPTFEVEGMILIKRLTLVIDNGQIIKVFYPVFPPDKNAAAVIEWLRANQDEHQPLQR
jgi:Peroxiredoxin